MNSLNATTAGYEELAGPRANDGAGWEPIGSLAPRYYLPFTGTFDGQGYEISDLLMARPDEEYVGLFGGVSSFGTDEEVIIDNLGVVNAVVTGRRSVGGLVGANDGTISNSYFSGSVTGGKRVGGLVGYDWRGNISDSCSRCDVTGNEDVGGLVGENGGTVSHSYSTGTVTGNWYVGGLVGYNESWGRVVNSYSTGNVTGELAIGGLVGASESGTTVSNSFWDTETSVMEESDGGTGKTAGEMMNVVTFTDTAIEGLDDPWDIITVAANMTDQAHTWNIVDGQTYPFLSWQSVQDVV